MSDFEDVLAHYGVKGMKWGVRKKSGGRDQSPTDVEVKTRPGKKVKTSGGKNQPATEDAKKAAVSRQKAKKSSLDSLTNDELREVVNRMNLEQQYSRLSSSRKSVGRKAVEALLTNKNAQSTVKDFATEAVGAAQLGQLLKNK